MAEVEHDPRVNVSCMDVADGFYLSVSGIARPADGDEPPAESATPAGSEIRPQIPTLAIAC